MDVHYISDAYSDSPYDEEVLRSPREVDDLSRSRRKSSPLTLSSQSIRQKRKVAKDSSIEMQAEAATAATTSSWTSWWASNDDKNVDDSTSPAIPYYSGSSPPPPPPPTDPSSRAHGKAEASEDYSLEVDGGGDAEDSEEPNALRKAHYKQKYAPLSTTFVILQIIILPIMMIQCGVAPLELNPMIGPYPDALNYWGAKNAVLIIQDGQVYRLVTPIFLHAGIIHLLGNVLVQIDSGNRWEKEWGSLVWFIIYIGSAIGSSVLSVICMPDQISVGSSGAIMGLFGGKFAEIVVFMCEKGKTVSQLAAEKSRRVQACHVILGIIIVMAMSFIPYVDWAAHLGGLVTGFVIGIVCFSFTMRSKFGAVFWLGVGIAASVVLYSTFIAIIFTTKTDDEMRDVCGYYQKHFPDYECKCMLDEAIQFGSWEIGGGASNNNGKNNNGNNGQGQQGGPDGGEGNQKGRKIM